jgi:hypothetical protein
LVDFYYSAPKCTWIDADHTNGIQAGMLMIGWTRFTGELPSGSNPRAYCGYPGLRAYTGKDGSGSIFKRHTTELSLPLTEAEHALAKRKIDSRLVITSHPSHNATELCESTTSRGPDMVNVSENVYCDMESRTTLPLCAGSSDVDCFNVDTKQKQGIGSKVRRSAKVFTDVLDWTAISVA